MQPRQLIERQLGFALGQGKTDDDVGAAELTPEALRRPFLRLRSAQAFDPDEVPLGHETSPKQLACWDLSPGCGARNAPISSWPGLAVRRTASLPLAYVPAIHPNKSIFEA